MRARVKITDLSINQWDRLQMRLRTEYDIQPGAATVCTVWELTPDMAERHVEMPVQDFATLMTELAMVGEAGLVATAALTPDELPDELVRIREAADPARGVTVQNTGAAVASGPGSRANTGYVTGQGHGAGWND